MKTVTFKFATKEIEEAFIKDLELDTIKALGNDIATIETTEESVIITINSINE